MSNSWLLVLPLLPALLGCPQERPGAERKIPAQSFPPAVSVESAPGDAGVAPPGDAGAPAPAAVPAAVPARRP